MTDKQIFENEIKCITRRNECICNGGTDCVKCDLLMDSEEILKCYNRALKNIDLLDYYKSEIERLEDKLEEKSTDRFLYECSRQRYTEVGGAINVDDVELK